MRKPKNKKVASKAGNIRWAVRIGFQRGIYATYQETQVHHEGYPRPCHMGFNPQQVENNIHHWYMNEPSSNEQLLSLKDGNLPAGVRLPYAHDPTTITYYHVDLQAELDAYHDWKHGPEEKPRSPTPEVGPRARAWPPSPSYSPLPTPLASPSYSPLPTPDSD